MRFYEPSLMMMKMEGYGKQNGGWAMASNSNGEIVDHQPDLWPKEIPIFKTAKLCKKCHCVYVEPLK